jgi:hypothetical protein
MDHNTLGDIFQEIVVEFSEMGPTNLDELEDRVLDAIYRIGACLMEWKFEDWNMELRQDKCDECSCKLENRKRERQIATWVSDITYERYRSNCPNCGKVEYALDKALGLQPRQRLSSSVEELAALCGASWKYEKSEHMMKKVLRRRCVSHETIFNKTNEIGEAASRELEGAKVKELEGDKRSQGEHFDNMEVWAEPAERVYMDMDGVMINSRDNEKCMEGKVAVV